MLSWLHRHSREATIMSRIDKKILHWSLSYWLASLASISNKLLRWSSNYSGSQMRDKGAFSLMRDIARLEIHWRSLRREENGRWKAFRSVRNQPMMTRARMKHRAPNRRKTRTTMTETKMLTTKTHMWFFAKYLWCHASTNSCSYLWRVP